MKNKIRLLTLIATGLMTLSACGNSGGGGESGEGGKRIVKFEFLKAGIGTEVYKKLAEAYTAEHPDVQIKLVANYAVNDTVSAALSTGKGLADIYSIRGIEIINQYYNKGYLINLNDVFDSVIEGDKKLVDMLDEGIADYCKYGDNYLAVPEYININGFVYNKKLFDQYNWSIPTTTEEMAALADKILADTNGSVKPFAYCGAAAQGYVYYLLNGINDAYEGIANLEKIHEFESPEVFNPDNRTGKLHALEMLRDWFTESNGYVYKGSMGLKNIQAQQLVLENKAAMILCGSWFVTEMAALIDEAKDDMAMFRIPEYSENGIVKHADGYTKNEGSDGVVYADIPAFYVIPSQAKNKEDAIDFLKFINRSDISELYTKYCNCVRPLKYNRDSSSEAYKDMSNFGKSVLDIANENTLYPENSKSPLAIGAGLTFWPLKDGDNYHYSKILNGGTSPRDCLKKEYDFVKSHWQEWLDLL